jgi:hypothetical protein
MTADLPTKASSSVLAGAVLKAERGWEHIYRLATIAEDLPKDWFWFGQDNYRSEVDNPPNRFTLEYRPTRPIPEMIALIIGDAVHNLRSALDHLATGVIRTLDPDSKPYFPMINDRAKLESSAVLNLMDQALPGSKELLLEVIRPKGGNRDWLWSFGDLDNDDKHNFVLPTVAVTRVSGWTVYDSGSVIQQNTFTFDARARYRVLDLARPFSVKGDPKIAIDFWFGPTSAFEGEPVLETLEMVHDVVIDTIEAFDDLLLRRERTRGPL